MEYNNFNSQANNQMNQFTDLMKNFANPEKLMEGMKGFPGMDLSALTNMVKKNTELMTTTNQMLAKNMQAMMEKAAKSMQDSTSEMLCAIKEISSSKDMEQVNSCAQNYMNSTAKKSMESSKEFMDIASKASMEIFQTINDNTQETMSKTCNSAKARS